MSKGVVAMEQRVVHSDPEILGGTPVFVGTRVPVKNLFDYLEGGYTLEQFLDQFPSVSRIQAIAALELGRISSLAAITLVRIGG
jgi:uncharacterized protein (DUF433 family)